MKRKTLLLLLLVISLLALAACSKEQATVIEPTATAEIAATPPVAR